MLQYSSITYGIDVLMHEIKLPMFSKILIVLSSFFSFFFSCASLHPIAVPLSEGVVGNVSRRRGKLQVANRFRLLIPRQGTRMGMLGVAKETKLVDNFYAPSMRGDVSSQHHVRGKIPYAHAEWSRVYLREGNLPASKASDVLQTYVEIRNAARRVPEATTTKKDQDRTHEGQQTEKHRGCYKIQSALCPYEDVGNLYHL